jgi:hypothetical protein
MLAWIERLFPTALRFHPARWTKNSGASLTPLSRD